MLPVSLLLAVQSSAPVLRREPTEFVLTASGQEVRVPLVAQAAEPVRTSYRKDETSVYWDATGLNIRRRELRRVSRLEDIALTPKLFSRAQILETRRKIEEGTRQRAASALSGSMRIGDQVYFLARWDEKGGKPWLEALVRVNLTAPDPKWQLVGRFRGLSGSTQPTDDRLQVSSAGLYMFVRDNAEIGVSTYTLSNGKFGYKRLSSDGPNVFPAGLDTVYLLENTDYGKVRVVLIDVDSGARSEILETKGEPKIDVEARPHLAYVQTNLGVVLRNLETGVQMLLPAQWRVRRTPFGLLVWPGGEPDKATLYSNERYLRLAVVTKP